VRLVDPTFDATDPQFIRETAPGYKGEVKVLASLVFEDVYPLLASMAQRAIDLWPPAILHPSQVYTGPAVPTQEAEWEEMRLLRGMMLGPFFQFLRTGIRPGGR
jgi:hypothetical protein